MKHKIIIAIGVVAVIVGVATAGAVHNNKVNQRKAQAAVVENKALALEKAHNKAVSAEFVRVSDECSKGVGYYNQVVATTPVKLRVKLVKPDCTLRVLQ